VEQSDPIRTRLAGPAADRYGVAEIFG